MLWIRQCKSSIKGRGYEFLFHISVHHSVKPFESLEFFEPRYILLIDSELFLMFFMVDIPFGGAELLNDELVAFLNFLIPAGTFVEIVVVK